MKAIIVVKLETGERRSDSRPGINTVRAFLWAIQLPACAVLHLLRPPPTPITLFRTTHSSVNTLTQRDSWRTPDFSHCPLLLRVPLCRRHPGFLEEEQLTGAKIYHTDDEAMHRKSTKCKRPRSLNDLTQELSLLMLPKLLLWSAISYLSFMMCEYFLGSWVTINYRTFYHVWTILSWLGSNTCNIDSLTFCFKRTKSWNFFQALKILKWICLAAASTKLKRLGGVRDIQLLLEISSKKMMKPCQTLLKNRNTPQKHKTRIYKKKSWGQRFSVELLHWAVINKDLLHATGDGFGS